MRKAGEEEDWKTRDRGGWKRLSDEAVKKLRAAPQSPLTKGNEEDYIYMCTAQIIGTPST